MTPAERNEATSVINRVAEFINVAVAQTHPAYQKQAAGERDAILNWLQNKLIGDISAETKKVVAEAKAAVEATAAPAMTAHNTKQPGRRLKKV